MGKKHEFVEAYIFMLKDWMIGGDKIFCSLCLSVVNLNFSITFEL